MSEIIEKAKKKFAEELKNFKGGQKEKTVSEPVYKTLTTFCNDNEEFAKAIVESKKTLSDCCKTILSDTNTGISDYEVYNRAVEFYYPTASIKFEMKLCLNEQEEETPHSGIISLLDLI